MTGCGFEVKLHELQTSQAQRTLIRVNKRKGYIMGHLLLWHHVRTVQRFYLLREYLLVCKDKKTKTNSVLLRLGVCGGCVLDIRVRRIHE